jgi:hypothetical protein
VRVFITCASIPESATSRYLPYTRRVSILPGPVLGGTLITASPFFFMFLVLRAECASSRILNASTALRLRHLDRPSVYASRGYSFSTPPTNDGNLETVTPGTAPPCGAYLVLHTTTPSSEWPSHPPLYSPLMRELILKLKPMKFVLNLSYDPNAPGRLPQSDAEKLEEVYSATLYRPMNPPIRIPSLSLRYIDDIDVHLDNSESLDPNIEGILVCKPLS